MNAAQIPSGMTFGVPAGAWRWAALVFGPGAGRGRPGCDRAASGRLDGLCDAGRHRPRWRRIFLFAVWPRRAAPSPMPCAWPKPPPAPMSPGPSPAEAARCWTAIPSIAAWQAWANWKAPPPPELALAGEPSAAVLYRLARDAAEGKAREETFVVVPGLEIVAAVRPLPKGRPPGGSRRAWPPAPAAARSDAAPLSPRPRPPLPLRSRAAPARFRWLLRDAPMGVAFADAAGALTDANAAWAKFFGSPARPLSPSWWMKPIAPG